MLSMTTACATPATPSSTAIPRHCPQRPASQLSSEPHSFSRVFTGAFLDALAGIVATLSSSPTADTLASASVDAGNILVGGILAAPAVPDYFTQVAAQMIQFAEQAPTMESIGMR